MLLKVCEKCLMEENPTRSETSVTLRLVVCSISSARETRQDSTYWCSDCPMCYLYWNLIIFRQDI